MSDPTIIPNMNTTIVFSFSYNDVADNNRKWIDMPVIAWDMSNALDGPVAIPAVLPDETRPFRWKLYAGTHCIDRGECK